MSELTDVQVSELVNEYQTPLYVIERELLTRSLESFRKAFARVHPNLAIAYPYKTNNLREVIRHFHSFGLWAEVASGIELEMAERLHVPGNRIVFNGPWKSPEDLRHACAHGVLVFIDNEPELRRLEQIAKEIDLGAQPVGIRVNTTKAVGAWSKFGFDIDDGTALSAAEYISKTPYLRLVGVHAHFRSNINDIALYRSLMTALSTFTDRLMSLGLLDLKYLDIGSGFAIPSPKPIGAAEWAVPSLNEYADVIVDCFSGLPDHVTLLVEPGRILVSGAVTLLTRVIAIKPGETRPIVIVDSGVNMVPGRDHYEYSIRSFNGHGRNPRACNVCGALCSNYDVLAIDVKLSDPQIGDVLGLLNVGAYDLARSFTWNLPLPPVVMIEEDGTHKVIRRRESVDDVWRAQLW